MQSTTIILGKNNDILGEPNLLTFPTFFSTLLENCTHLGQLGWLSALQILEYIQYSQGFCIRKNLRIHTVLPSILHQENDFFQSEMDTFTINILSFITPIWCGNTSQKVWKLHPVLNTKRVMKCWYKLTTLKYGFWSWHDANVPYILTSKYLTSSGVLILGWVLIR